MRTIRYYVDKQAKEQPDNVFMVAPEPNLVLTYAKLRDSCVQFGTQFMKMGLRKGDKISFMMGNGYQTTRIFLGAMYFGLVIAPINLNAQPSQLTYVLEHSDTQLVFVTEFQSERLMEALAGVSRKIEVVVIDKDAEEIFPETSPLGYELPEVTPGGPCAAALYFGNHRFAQRVRPHPQEHDSRWRERRIGSSTDAE